MGLCEVFGLHRNGTIKKKRRLPLWACALPAPELEHGALTPTALRETPCPILQMRGRVAEFLSGGVAFRVWVCTGWSRCPSGIQKVLVTSPWLLLPAAPEGPALEPVS